MDIELFTVVLNQEGNVVIKFSNDIKSSVPVSDLEELLKEDVKEHLTPIITKLITAAF
ncbi:hypothetical protein [Clostridium botulinum]|uniref:hypothetical protein n=1 Tax=Clostridium botulinum TaxID=1491 RepID=UPI000A82DAFB|nr:hypothetical protein [Clostridium botulinum]